MKVKRIVFVNRAPFGNLDIDFSDHQVVSLTGINGAGKTTILTYIVDAFYERAVFLDAHGHHKYADDAYLSSYSRLASAFTLLDYKDKNVKSRLDELMVLYKSFYKRLVKDDHIVSKQKIKLRLFRYFPRIHARVFPMRMK